MDPDSGVIIPDPEPTDKVIPIPDSNPTYQIIPDPTYGIKE